MEVLSAVLHTRVCVLCGASDTDPKHIIDFGGRAEAFHLDCHAHGAPSCESCAAQIVGADGVTGSAFRAYLMGGG